MHKVAVVVSSEGEWRARALDALKRQTVGDVEVIVASVDSLQAARALCDGFERFAWLGDGVVPHPEWLESLLAVDAGAVTCDSVVVSASCADLGAPVVVDADAALQTRGADTVGHVARRLLLRRVDPEPERKGLLSRWR